MNNQDGVIKMNLKIEDLEFQWEDLHGSNLYIQVGVAKDEKEKVTVVTGYDVDTGHIYVLHTEVKRVEK